MRSLKATCDKLRLKFKIVANVTPPPYPKYFLIVFKRFTKITFVRSRGTVSPGHPQWRRP